MKTERFMGTFDPNATNSDQITSLTIKRLELAIAYQKAVDIKNAIEKWGSDYEDFK